MTVKMSHEYRISMVVQINDIKGDAYNFIKYRDIKLLSHTMYHGRYIMGDSEFN